MNQSARYQSLIEAMTKSPLNKKIVRMCIFADEEKLKKVLRLEQRNEFLNDIVNELKETRQKENWLANGGYFKILDWGEKVAAESKYISKYSNLFSLIIIYWILIFIFRKSFG